MATNTTTTKRMLNRSATIQWVAIGVVIALAILAAFVFFGDDTTGGGGGHTGAAVIDGEVLAAR